MEDLATYLEVSSIGFGLGCFMALLHNAFVRVRRDMFRSIHRALDD